MVQFFQPKPGPRALKSSLAAPSVSHFAAVSKAYRCYLQNVFKTQVLLITISPSPRLQSDCGITAGASDSSPAAPLALTHASSKFSAQLIPFSQRMSQTCSTLLLPTFKGIKMLRSLTLALPEGFTVPSRFLAYFYHRAFAMPLQCRDKTLIS